MTIQEHLQRIRAKCVQLLELAERRTPGEWYRRDEQYSEDAGIAVEIATFGDDGLPRQLIARVNHCDINPLQKVSDTVAANAHLIAACAGPAEAGWRSTIAAIDELAITDSEGNKDWVTGNPSVKAIINAWPEELL